MSNTCQSEVVPIYQNDECNGERKSTTCIIDENTFTQLGLEENSTQEQINNALYVALISLKAQVDAMQEIIDNL